MASDPSGCGLMTLHLDVRPRSTKLPLGFGCEFIFVMSIKF